MSIRRSGSFRLVSSTASNRGKPTTAALRSPAPTSTRKSALPPVRVHVAEVGDMRTRPTAPPTVVDVSSPLDRTMGVPWGIGCLRKANSRASRGAGTKSGVSCSSNSKRATTRSSSSSSGRSQTAPTARWRATDATRPR